MTSLKNGVRSTFRNEIESRCLERVFRKMAEQVPMFARDVTREWAMSPNQDK